MKSAEILSAIPMTPSPLLLTTFSFLAASFYARAQLTLNQIGGSIGAGNLGTLGTTSAFGLDEIGGGTPSRRHRSRSSRPAAQ